MKLETAVDARSAESERAMDLEAVRGCLSAVIRGKQEAVDLLLVGVLSGGHVLLEDVPGVGKTTLAKALAAALGSDFARVQFTPDLLPADIIGSQVLDPADGSFRFRAGPIFAHVVLADEINRASPRTQSALLEAMSEEQVTAPGETHPLPQPFCVIATQNPVGFQGTYPLPEAQLDRFGLCFALGHPDLDTELDIIEAHRAGEPIARIRPVASVEEWRATLADVRAVRVKREVARYMLQIVERTRSHPQIEIGVSTRGALAFYRAAQARAHLEGRDFVSPDDFQQLAVPVLAHRIKLGAETRYGGRTPADWIVEVITEVKPPI